MRLWLAIGAPLMLFAGLLAVSSHRFDWELPVRQMPAATLGFAMAAAGVAYMALLPVIRASLRLPSAARKHLLALMVAIGVGLRLMVFFGEPALEDDYYRYMWEGALTANGISPYAVSPRAAKAAAPDTVVGRLAEEAGPVLARVSHPDMTSTYPPVAQAAFALAYLASPWNLAAWKIVALAGDAATMVLLLMLLGDAGRSSLWAALYWWNPIVIKEIANSGHMDAIVTALVLAALLCGARQRRIGAVLMLGLAIGSKLWPALLVPLVLRPLWPRLLPLTAALAPLLTMTALWLVPTWWHGLDPDAGYVAYVQHWTTNSALSPAIESLSRLSLRPFGLEQSAWAAARISAALVLGGFALWQAKSGIAGTPDLMRRAAIVTASLVLLSPAQFPWYMIWMLPFLAFRPSLGLLATTVTVPLYYVAFHLYARDSYAVFKDWVVWAIWAPVWVLLLVEALSRRAGWARWLHY